VPKLIHEDVRPQLKDLQIDPSRPMLITDADEVLFNFMQGLEGFLEENGMYFDWASFALRGNIRHKENEEPVNSEQIPKLLDQFFADYCHRLPAVSGAAEHLERLSKDMQVIVLSNVPPQYADLRKEGLQKNGMDFPLIANIGSKGEVVEYLTRHLSGPSVFIDDIPHNHSSVKKHADHVERVHYIADERLARLLGPAEHSHVRLESWPDIYVHIQDLLNGK